MRKLVHVMVGVALLAVSPPAFAADEKPKLTPEQKAAEAEERKRLGSLHVRCDGNPNNMSDAESFGRILGALTLLSIFAPAPESPDPGKRLFGAAGVDACSKLVEPGEKYENNAFRRLPLLLARAIHRIEAKEYAAAIADVDKARGEAKALALIGNPYFDRSMGLSFDNIEAEARLRLDDALGAQEVSLRRLDTINHGFLPMIFANDYGEYMRSYTPRAEQLQSNISRLSPGSLNNLASDLEESGRFADAAARREALLIVLEGLKPKHPGSLSYANAALSHALAGNWDKAKQRANFARSNLEQRNASGVPEDNAAKVVEVLDLYDIVRQFNEGQLKEARRSFAARSQWISPSFGAVREVNKRLRAGASQDELFGSLGPTPEQLWEDRKATRLAAKLQQDTDNKTLFGLMLPYARINEFEAQSKDTWRLDKPKMISAEPNKETGHYSIFAWGPFQTRYDSIVLHAALRARQKGKQGFTMMLIPTEYGTSGLVKFVDKTEEGVDPALFVAAAPVIEELGKLIPSPVELEARKKSRGKN
jgi:hypothetical protein